MDISYMVKYTILKVIKLIYVHKTFTCTMCDFPNWNFHAMIFVANESNDWISAQTLNRSRGSLRLEQISSVREYCCSAAAKISTSPRPLQSQTGAASSESKVHKSKSELCSASGNTINKDVCWTKIALRFLSIALRVFVLRGSWFFILSDVIVWNERVRRENQSPSQDNHLIFSLWLNFYCFYFILNWGRTFAIMSAGEDPIFLAHKKFYFKVKIETSTLL